MSVTSTEGFLSWGHSHGLHNSRYRGLCSSGQQLGHRLCLVCISQVSPFLESMRCQEKGGTDHPAWM